MKVKHHLILRDVKDAVPYIVLVDTSIVGVGFPDDPPHRNFFLCDFHFTFILTMHDFSSHTTYESTTAIVGMPNGHPAV